MKGVMTYALKRVSVWTAPPRHGPRNDGFTLPGEPSRSELRALHAPAFSNSSIIGLYGFRTRFGKACRRVCIRGKHVASERVRTRRSYKHEGSAFCQGRFAQRNYSTESQFRGASPQKYRLMAVDNKQTEPSTDSGDDGPETGGPKRTPRKYPRRKNKKTPWEWFTSVINPVEVCFQPALLVTLHDGFPSDKDEANSSATRYILLIHKLTCVCLCNISHQAVRIVLQSVLLVLVLRSFSNNGAQHGKPTKVVQVRPAAKTDQTMLDEWRCQRKLCTSASVVDNTSASERSTSAPAPASQVAYSDFVRKVKANEVADVVIDATHISWQPHPRLGPKVRETADPHTPAVPERIQLQTVRVIPRVNPRVTTQVTGLLITGLSGTCRRRCV
eukprot:1195910-Prorocentrum_minimum.AAC.4